MGGRSSLIRRVSIFIIICASSVLADDDDAVFNVDSYIYPCDKNNFEEFHRCLCSANSESCQLLLKLWFFDYYVGSAVTVNISSDSLKYVNYFICKVESHISCNRQAENFNISQMRNAALYNMSCGQSCVNLMWDYSLNISISTKGNIIQKSQNMCELSVVYWPVSTSGTSQKKHSSAKGEKYSDPGEKTTTYHLILNGNEEETIPKTGVIIGACVFVFFGIVVIGVWMYIRCRRTSATSSSSKVTSSDSSQHGNIQRSNPNDSSDDWGQEIANHKAGVKTGVVKIVDILNCKDDNTFVIATNGTSTAVDTV